MAHNGTAKALSGTTGTVVSAAFGVYLQKNPLWGNLHPKMADGLYVLAALLCVYTLLQWSLVQRLLGFEPKGREPETGYQLGNGNQVGRDNTGKMIQGNVVHIHEAPPVAPEVPEVKTNKEPNPTVIQPVLDLKTHWHNLSYDNGSGSWREDSFSGQFSLVIWVTNPLPPVGKSGRSIHSLAAHVRLSCESGSNTTVARAYWLNRPENQVSLSVGERAGVVVGYSEGAAWIVHQNPFETSPYDNSFFSGFRPIGEKHLLPKISPILVEVTLIDARRNATLESRKYRISVAGNSWRVAELI